MKKITSILLSLIILAVIYWKIDFHGLIKVIRYCNVSLMIISLGMVVPLILLSARRLQQLMPHGAILGFGEANRLILVASVMNMILPMKMGDIAKAYFLKNQAHLDGSYSLSLVIFEKACDMISLLLWCAFGLILYPKKDLFFWVMTGSVILGLITCLLLFSSRKFTQICFALMEFLLPKRFRSKLEKLHSSWDEMHDFFWSDKIQLFKIAGTFSQIGTEL